MLVVVAQPLGNSLGEVAHHLVRREAQKLIPPAAIDASEERFPYSRCLGRTSSAVQQRHLTKKIALQKVGQRLLLSATPLLRNFDRTLRDQIETVARFVLCENEISGPTTDHLYLAFDRTVGRGIETAEQRILPEQLCGGPRKNLRVRQSRALSRVGDCLNYHVLGGDYSQADGRERFCGYLS